MLRYWLGTWILPLTAALFVIGLAWYYVETHQPVAATAPTATVKTAQSASSSKLKVVVLPAQSAAISATATPGSLYDNPYLRYVRTALNTYLAGKTDGIARQAIASSTYCGLDSFSTDYFRSPFFYFQAKNSQYGGLAADIVFTDKPDAIFEVHVDRLATGQYQLVGFCQVGPQPGREVALEELVNGYLASTTVRTL